MENLPLGESEATFSCFQVLTLQCTVYSFAHFQMPSLPECSCDSAVTPGLCHEHHLSVCVPVAYDILTLKSYFLFSHTEKADSGLYLAWRITSTELYLCGMNAMYLEDQNTCLRSKRPQFAFSVMVLTTRLPLVPSI